MLALLFVAALLPIAGQSGYPSEGLAALDRQDYQKAEEFFQKLAADNPQDYGAIFNLAIAETGLKKDAEAAQHYKQVLALKPGLYQAELNLGILYLRDRRAQDALPLLEDAARQKPDQARPKRYSGDALLATGDFAGAADAYRAALRLDPKLAPAELGLGQSLAGQGKLDDALPHYRQAAVLDGNLKSYLLEMAVAFSKANRVEDTIAILKEFPDDPAAREELGRLYLKANRASDAVSEFQAAVAMSPTEANRTALAMAYLANKQPDLAAPILERALAANPNSYELRMAIGRIHRDKHDYKEAANEFIAAANLKPDSVEAWNEAASAFVISDQFPQALAALDKVHNLNAETAGDFYYRAIVLDKLHRLKPALAAYQQFLEASKGKYPDQEFIARQRSRILEKEANR